jgi:hypothetical protein
MEFSDFKIGMKVEIELPTMYGHGDIRDEYYSAEVTRINLDDKSVYLRVRPMMIFPEEMHCYNFKNIRIFKK